MRKTPEKPKKYEERLMAAFAFDEADLEANQVGQISQRQIEHFLTSQRKAVAAAALLMLMVALWVGFILFVARLTGSPMLLFLSVAALISLASLAVFGLQIYRLRADLHEDHVLTAEGRIDLSLKPGQNKADYFMRVSGVRFRIKQKTFLALKNGDPYTIYYARRSKRILSVEWLREADPHLIDETTGDQASDILDMNLRLEQQEKAKRS